MDKHNSPVAEPEVKRPQRGLGLTGCILGAILFLVIGIGVGRGSLSLTTLQDRQSSQNSSLPNTLNYSSVDSLYNLLKDRYDGKLNEKQLLDGIKTGLVEATGDTHTEYFNAADAKKFNDQLEGSFSGIGAQLGQDADKSIEVIAPVEGSPAAKAGVRPQDLIIQINGKSTTGMPVDEAVSLIRGAKGTKVTLQIVRDKQDAITLTITRDDITIPSVTHKILDNNVGYLQISQFSSDTANLAQQAAAEFKDKQVKGIVLDLRGNPGGRVDAAVDVSSMWLPSDKTILQEKRGGQLVKTYKSTGTDELAGIPTIVLINKGSASASEITAGALRDNNVARLLGELSYGKGSVQEVRDLPDGSELKVTVARWYRPNGENIDKKGITPDTVLKLSDDDYKAGNDTQLQAAQTQLAK